MGHENGGWMNEDQRSAVKAAAIAPACGFCHAPVGSHHSGYCPVAINADEVHKFHVGDMVMCHEPGSWVDGKTGTIISLDAKASDGICGLLIQMDSGVTVLPSCNLTKSTTKLLGAEKSTLADHVAKLAIDYRRLLTLAGEMLATIKLNHERGYLVVVNDEGKLNLAKIVDRWQARIKKLE